MSNHCIKPIYSIPRSKTYEELFKKTMQQYIIMFLKMAHPRSNRHYLSTAVVLLRLHQKAKRIWGLAKHAQTIDR